jgi:hypothetical protein
MMEVVEEGEQSDEAEEAIDPDDGEEAMNGKEAMDPDDGEEAEDSEFDDDEEGRLPSTVGEGSPTAPVPKEGPAVKARPVPAPRPAPKPQPTAPPRPGVKPAPKPQPTVALKSQPTPVSRRQVVAPQAASMSQPAAPAPTPAQSKTPPRRPARPMSLGDTRSFDDEIEEARRALEGVNEQEEAEKEKAILIAAIKALAVKPGKG